jgi:hypothetical protein
MRPAPLLAAHKQKEGNPMTDIICGTAMRRARHLREETERIERDRLEHGDLLGAKTARRDAELDLARRERAEAHRLAALPILADRLAEACFTYAEQAERRVMVRDQLAQALLAVLLKSGLHRDSRFDRPPPD